MKSFKKIMLSLFLVALIQISLFSLATAVPSDYCLLSVSDRFEYSYKVYDDGVLYQDAPFNATVNTLTNTTAGSVESTEIDYTVDNGTGTEDFERVINSTDSTIEYTYTSLFGAPYEILFISTGVSPKDDFTEWPWMLGGNNNITANYSAEGILTHYRYECPQFGVGGPHRVLICELIDSDMSNNATSSGTQNPGQITALLPPGTNQDVQPPDVGDITTTLTVNTSDFVEMNVSATTTAPSGVTTLSDTLVFVQISVNDSQAVDFPVTLHITYTDAELVDAGLSEDDLTIYYFNEASDEWEELTATVNADDNYVEVTLDHFSTYALGIESDNGSGPDIPGYTAIIVVSVLVLGYIVFNARKRSKIVKT